MTSLFSFLERNRSWQSSAIELGTNDSNVYFFKTKGRLRDHVICKWRGPTCFVDDDEDERRGQTGQRSGQKKIQPKGTGHGHRLKRGLFLVSFSTKRIDAIWNAIKPVTSHQSRALRRGSFFVCVSIICSVWFGLV